MRELFVTLAKHPAPLIASCSIAIYAEFDGYPDVLAIDAATEPLAGHIWDERESLCRYARWLGVQYLVILYSGQPYAAPLECNKKPSEYKRNNEP